MKYLITENKLEKVVFKFLDGKDLKMVKKKIKHYSDITSTRIFFVLNESDKTSEITYDGWSGKLFISSVLCDEVFNFFSLEDEGDSEIIISDWVESKINKEIDIFKVQSYHPDSFSGSIFEID
jgi:hypothetical protein